MKLFSSSFTQGGKMPSLTAFGRCAIDGQTHRSSNLNPDLSWFDVPEGTASFALACLDDDVPTNLEERSLAGEIPMWQMRRRFVHWVQADIPLSVREIALGALANEKKLTKGYGIPGVNDYSRGEAVELGGVGTGYDGPCPPSVDSRWHFYRFVIFALDVETLGLTPGFTWDDLQAAMDGHVLGAAEWVGRYSLNKRLQDE